MHTSQKINTNNAFLQKDLQKEIIKNSLLPSPDNISTRPFLTSLISQNNITPPNVQPLTKNHACSTSDNNLLSSVNIHLATNNQNNIATKQTLMVINNANQQDNKDLDKKTNANY